MRVTDMIKRLSLQQCTFLWVFAAMILSTSTSVLDASDVDGMSQRTKDIVAQLKAMESQDGRTMDIYELIFFPGALKNITVSDRLGNSKVYHYMTFRLRNPGLGEGADKSIAEKLLLPSIQFSIIKGAQKR